jgi:hypothetical protein
VLKFKPFLKAKRIILPFCGFAMQKRKEDKGGRGRTWVGKGGIRERMKEGKEKANSYLSGTFGFMSWKINFCFQAFQNMMKSSDEKPISESCAWTPITNTLPEIPAKTSKSEFLPSTQLSPVLHPSPHPSSPFTLHPSPFTLHPSPFTLHPSHFTLHPSPFTLHPSPFTLHPFSSPFIFSLPY